MKKLVFALILVAALLVVAMPALAQGPRPLWVVKAGTNEDPFGGLPIGYGQGPQGEGSVAMFGLSPLVRALPGGVPSNKSGDGTSPRKSIYIGGAWAERSAVSMRTDIAETFGNTKNLAVEIPTCATLKIPSGVSRWFKMDTWKDKKLQVWLDDEKNDATAPSGSAVWGASNSYMWGTAPGDGWQAVGWDTPGQTSYKYLSGPFLEGFVMAILDPNNLRPNYAYAAPNAALYTVNVNSGASPRVGTQGMNQQTMWQGDLKSVSAIIGETNTHGYGQFNPNQPSHLLFYEGRFDGWVHARIYNNMIWDGVATVCSYRAP